MVGPSCEPDQGQALLHPLPSLPPADASDAQHQVHVFPGGEGGQESERLEHEADAVSPQMGSLPFRKARDLLPFDEHLAGRGPIQAADAVEQRRLAGAGAPLDGHESAGQDLQIHSPQGMYLLASNTVDPPQSYHTHDGFNVHRPSPFSSIPRRHRRAHSPFALRRRGGLSAPGSSESVTTLSLGAA